MRGFEWANPGIAIDVKAHVARFNHVACRKSRAANHARNVLRENFFIADAVLHGANRAARAKNVRGLHDGGTRVRALRGHDSEITKGNLPGVRSCVKLGREIRDAADAQPALGDGTRLFFRNIVRVHLNIFETRQMSAENAADRPTANDANFDLHAVFNSSAPE